MVLLETFKATHYSEMKPSPSRVMVSTTRAGPGVCWLGPIKAIGCVTLHFHPTLTHL